MSRDGGGERERERERQQVYSDFRVVAIAIECPFGEIITTPCSSTINLPFSRTNAAQ
jgi:hypothetical protein